jgi:hypothetical protein
MDIFAKLKGRHDENAALGLGLFVADAYTAGACGWSRIGERIGADAADGMEQLE